MGQVVSYGYHHYLSTPAWRAKRELRLDIDEGKCVRCKATKRLEVHHVDYSRLGNEDVEKDLLTLCHYCHALEHGKDPTVPPELPASFFHELFERKMTFECWQEVLADAISVNALLESILTWGGRQNDQRAKSIRGNLNSVMRDLAHDFGQEWEAAA